MLFIVSTNFENPVTGRAQIYGMFSWALKLQQKKQISDEKFRTSVFPIN